MTTAGQPSELSGYERFFGFHEAPFSLAPNPRYLFESTSHAAALAQVAYAIERREPLVVVTGEIGTGKTLLCRTVLRRLGRATFVSVINNPLLERDDLLKQLLQDFGVMSKDRTIPASATRHDLVHALEAFLASLGDIQAHAVVIIDEAQHIKPEVLEQIRLLSNVDDARGTLLQIVLVGQTDLDRILTRPDLRQFQQRISRRVRLEPLTADELRAYVDHRVTVAQTPPAALPGAAALARAMAEWEPIDPPVAFTADAIDALWRLSGGLPRVVNLLCDRALEAAYGQHVRIVDAALIDSAARALSVTEPLPSGTADTPALPSFEPGDGVSPEPVEAVPAPVARPRAKRITVLAASLAIAAVAIWFAARAATSHAEPPASTHPQQPAPSAVPAKPRPTPPPAPQVAPPPETSAATPPSAAVTPPAGAQSPTSNPPAGAPAAGSSAPARTPNQAASPQMAAASGSSAGASFEIVIASFHTEARAAEVAGGAGHLGIPVRIRATGGWQQVIAGPFASRDAAAEAQQRLERGGFRNTAIISPGK